MSSTSMSHEFAESAEAFNWDWKVIRWMTVNAMKSAFIPFDERLEIINDTIKPLVRRARTTRRKPAHRTPPVLRALGPHNCIDTVASMSNYRARAALAADVERIKEIAVAAEMFSVDEVSFFDDMLAGFFDGSLEGHRWLVIDDGHGQVLAAANYAPEPFSDRMWNLYFIAVDPEHQGAGLGSTLMAHAESELRAKGPEQARVLIVETSSTDQFARTRDFYAKIGSVTTKRPVCVSSMVQTMTRSCSGNRWWPERFCVSCRLVQRGGEVVVDGGVVAAQGRGVDRLEEAPSMVGPCICGATSPTMRKFTELVRTRLAGSEQHHEHDDDRSYYRRRYRRAVVTKGGGHGVRPAGRPALQELPRRDRSDDGVCDGGRRRRPFRPP
ncbi:Adenosine deaminase 1 [Nymphon striatum]|nr:Adenosine deaminase 1 [Nymphon striatum]